MTYNRFLTWLSATALLFSFLWVPAACEFASFINPDKRLLDKFQLLGTFAEPLKKSPYLGGQNFTQCCVKAVTQAYVVSPSGEITNNPNKNYPSLGISAEALGNQQFPCGATYNDSQGDKGAPQVTVPYKWCQENCGGWQQSKNSNLNQWVQPFVGFILPAAVFCLNIPRKFAIGVPDDLFKDALKVLFVSFFQFVDKAKALRDRIKGIDNDIGNDSPKTIHVVVSFITFGAYVVGFSILTVIRGTLAASIALLDTVIWVSVCFSEACPMVLSGLYEATLDRRVIDIIHRELEKRREIAEKTKAEKEREKRNKEEAEFERYKQKMLEKRRKRNKKVAEEHPKTTDGNTQNLKPHGHDLDVETMVESTRSEDRHHDEHNIQQTAPELHRRIHLLYAVIVGNLVQESEDAPEDAAENKKSMLDDALENRNARHDIRKQRSAWNDVKDLIKDEDKDKTKTRLTTMLGCQASFGAAIGAPVVFFLGAFLFSVFSNLQVVGDNDTSHALAFGMWWMTIPHVAVVGGCLLAGNNPNTLEAIACGAIEGWSQISPREKDPDEKPVHWIKLLFCWVIALYKPFYTSVYRPVWMWERGRNKREWIRHVLDEHWNVINAEVTLTKRPTWNWNAYLRSSASKVKTVSRLSGDKAPDEEAQTKEKDIDNFDLDFFDWIELLSIDIILLLIPFVLAFLTSYYTPAIGLSCRTFTFLLYFCFQILLSIVWAWDFPHTQPSPLTTKAEWVPFIHRRPTIYCLLRGFCFLGSLFTAIIGTLMQILGVYRNCLCTIPMSAWGSRDFMLPISTNTGDNIRYARHYWVNTAIASIVLLIVVCYVGWWYQRHWRYKFTNILDILLKDSQKRVESTVPSQSVPSQSVPSQSEKVVQPAVPEADDDGIRPVPPRVEE